MTVFSKFVRQHRSQQEFASEAGTTCTYLTGNLLYSKRCPKPRLWIGLIEASKGKLTDQDLVEHFIYNNPQVINKKHKGDVINAC